MREKILNTASEMFLDLGFKSVTMDDIAQEMGISKKTIYAHFSTKGKLVEACTAHLFQLISTGIKNIREEKKNPIVELYEIKKFTMLHLKDEKTSPQYQLQKYYPKIYNRLRGQQFDLVQQCVVENLERGITSGHYRQNLPISFVSRIHFAGMLGIKDQRLFPAEEYSTKKLMEYFLEYHLRAISTPNGLEILQQLIDTNEKDH